MICNILVIIANSYSFHRYLPSTQYVPLCIFKNVYILIEIDLKCKLPSTPFDHTKHLAYGYCSPQLHKLRLRRS